jgi:uncharacterized protein YdeI (YjbR/CyaY-like superfamily)
VFFSSPEDFRQWLAENHDTQTEALVGFHKKATGVPSITWAESVDEALCYGWIDGVRKRLDDDRYTIRFTPRKPGSIWSNRNVQQVEALAAAGRMQPAGFRAYEARSNDRTGIYSFEQNCEAVLPPEYERQLQANAVASEFFGAQAPWYRRAAIHWVVSAKREATRDRRMSQLIEDSAAGRTVRPLTRNR